MEGRGIPGKGKVSAKAPIWESAQWSSVTEGKSEWDSKRNGEEKKCYGEKAEMD